MTAHVVSPVLRAVSARSFRLLTGDSAFCDRVRTSIGCERVRCRQYSYTCNTCAVCILAVDLDGVFGGSVSWFARPRGRLADHYFCLLAPSRVAQAVHRPGTRACARTRARTHTQSLSHTHTHTHTHTGAQRLPAARPYFVVLHCFWRHHVHAANGVGNNHWRKTGRLGEGRRWFHDHGG